MPVAERRPGDLLFFARAGVVYHDALYAGHDLMWAAPHTGDVVRLQKVYSTAYVVGRPGPSPLVREGATGPAVADLQRRLRLPADGAFGPRTTAALGH